MPVTDDDYEWEKCRGERIITLLGKALTPDRNWPARVLRSDAGLAVKIYIFFLVTEPSKRCRVLISAEVKDAPQSDLIDDRVGRSARKIRARVMRNVLLLSGVGMLERNLQGKAL